MHRGPLALFLSIGSFAFSEPVATRVPSARPFAAAVDSAGRLYAAESNVIRRYDSSGASAVVAGGGNGASGTTDVPATSIGIRVSRITLDKSGSNLFFSEDRRIRKVSLTTGIITTVAGATSSSLLGDGGPANSAGLDNPRGLAIDAAGNIYVADSGNNRIRKIDAISGLITSVAGDGFLASPDSIPAPQDVAVAPNGDLFIASETALRVWRFSNGKLTVIAGVGSSYTSFGDGGSSVFARLCFPTKIELDPQGFLYIGERICGTVRRVDLATGIIQSVAGGGKGLTTSSGSAFDLNSPVLLTLGSDIMFVTTNTGDLWKIPNPAPLDQNPPRMTDLVNAATFAGSNPTPRGLMTIFGNYLGPATPRGLELDERGYVKSELAGVRVYFNEIPAPLTYVSASQVNLVVPFGLTGPGTVRIETPAGRAEWTYSSTTSFSTGFFPGAIVNPDGSINGPENPAPRGATLVLYGTGIGPIATFMEDGYVPQTAIPTRTTPQVSASGYILQVPYFGQAPGLVGGVLQANVKFPDNRPDGVGLLDISTSTLSAAVPVYVGRDMPKPVITKVTVNNQLTARSRTISIEGSGFLERADGGPFYEMAEIFRNGVKVGAVEARPMILDKSRISILFDFGFNLGSYEVQIIHPLGGRSNRFAFDLPLAAQ